ncbi:hypothetical protein [Mycobacterium sp. ACS4331]|uniref:hypothetical protein n=1 Tax=Mycobacterium sp. ACS4331 TaxID=1834121 RepID=UPI0008007C85|nr:hypothetical protein [Mycobacterium sp. ACS4331]OBF30452.1 hypothetical protein A5727_00110 [Mycobacterium sp. ACS4331]
MATTRLMATVLPYSTNPHDDHHVSLFISHRLGDGGTLNDYPAMVNWVKTLQNATITLRSAEAGGTTIPCTPLVGRASQSHWQTAFPPDTHVAAYPEPKPATATWNSFPAHRMPDHALDVHNAAALSSPIDRPRVIGNPLAADVLRVFRGAEAAGAAISELEHYDRSRRNRRERLGTERADAARRAVHPVKPRPDVPIGPALEAAQIPEAPWRSPIEMLLGRDDANAVDADITALLDFYVEHPDQIGEDATLAMLVDLHRAQRYFHRPEEQAQPDPDPDPDDAQAQAQAQARIARTPHPVPDFHERVASACNVPALARTLGIVVDVKVDDLDVLRRTTRIWCEIEFPGVTDIVKYLSPETLCIAEGDRLLAVAKDSSRWKSGRMLVGDAQRFRVMDLDPDAGGLGVEQLCRSTVRALAVELNGDPGSFAPAGLRGTGFAIAELQRSDRLQQQIAKSEALTPVIEQPGTGQTRQQFHFEGLLRGTRLEVWDDTTKRWHSLHERLVTASFTTTPILTDVEDPGLLQNPPLSRVPGNPNYPYYVHEVLAGWDGWSLSAPRPGKLVIHNDATQDEPGRERLTDTAESTESPGLWVRSRVKAGSLPALRYGRRYSFRIAGVDLAGNSVPLDSVPPALADQPLIDMAAAHLDSLRAEASAREQSGVLTALRPSLRPTVSDGTGVRADIERATASVVEKAESLRPHPQWDDVDLGALATLFADAGDPNVVTVPRLFLRWDPIPAPTLVPRSAYTTGESVQRLVIRTGMDSGPGLCERHIVPPKGSELEAEQDGRLDEFMRTGQVAKAYATALKERGTLYHKEIQDLNDPDRTIPQPGIKLLSMPDVTDPLTLEQIQHPENPPKAGQYVVHDVDNLVLPHLPDPMAHGVALVFHAAGADHRLSSPRVLQTVTVPYAGSWPSLTPYRLVLHAAKTLDARVDGNVIHVGLPPGEQVSVKYATTLDAEHLQKMGPWRFHPVHDPSVPASDRRILEQAALDGWMWWLTPDEELRLVHATARPAIAPRISRLRAEPRAPYIVTAELDGVLDVHGSSTDRVELRAAWTEPVDDPSAPDPGTRTIGEIVVDHRIDEHERYSLLTNRERATQVGTRRTDVPIRPAIHILPDTKARAVTYRLHGSSRYREFFEADELPGPDDTLSAGNEVEVNIPSSAPPAPPVVHDVIPMFLWEQTTEPEHPFAVRRVRRSGVRIWLDRPWYSSGDGEMLAIITTGDPALISGGPEKVSLWARDPIVASPAFANAYEVPVLSAWQQRAVQLQLAPESLPGRPTRHVVVTPPPSANPEDQDKMVNAYAYTPEFHRGRGMWFVDVVLESRGAAWPFLRLAVARYQPNSVPGMEFSEIVTTDFVQLPPERIGTLSRPDGQSVRITVTGSAAVTNDPRIDVPPPTPGHDALMQLLPKSHEVIATVQTRNLVSGSDIDWVSGVPVPCLLSGVDETSFTATWTAELDLVPPQILGTPPGSDDLRVQVEEFENLSADPAPGETGVSTTRRLVYADHFYV